MADLHGHLHGREATEDEGRGPAGKHLAGRPPAKQCRVCSSLSRLRSAAIMSYRVNASRKSQVQHPGPLQVIPGASRTPSSALPVAASPSQGPLPY